MNQTPDFRGIYASTICPFDARGAIDEPALERHLRMVTQGTGVRGVLLNGHAGENAVLDRGELRRVIEIGRRISRNCLIVAGVNAESSVLAALLARDAAEAGADAIMVFAPFSWALGTDARVIVRHHEAIAEATPLPLFLFQGSIRAGRLAFRPDVLRALLNIQNVIGIKEGSWETSAYDEVRRATKALRPDVAVMASGDEHLFTCFVLGSDGSLVSLAAVIPELIVALDEAVKLDDLKAARQLHDRIYPLAKAVYGMPPWSLATARLKACLRILGRLDRATCRAPVGDLTAEEYERLARALAEAEIRPSSAIGAPSSPLG